MLRDGRADIDASWGEDDRTIAGETYSRRCREVGGGTGERHRGEVGGGTGERHRGEVGSAGERHREQVGSAGERHRGEVGSAGELHREGVGGGTGERHREIDRELRAIAQQKARLEVVEARWLREAERHRIWRTLGFSTALEYLEDVFGYAPRTAKDRLRVAKELAELPELEAELREGRLPYSAARELTRVMTRATQAAWLARARGKNLRDIEELVAGHKKGDDPDDPKDPALMTRTLVLKLAPRALALLQQTRTLFEAERGEHLDDEALIEAMCLRVLEGGTVESVSAGAMLESVRSRGMAKAVSAGALVESKTTNAMVESGPTNAMVASETTDAMVESASTPRRAPRRTRAGARGRRGPRIRS